MPVHRIRSIILVIMFLASPALAIETVSLESLLSEMTARDSMGKIPMPIYAGKQASSYDREQTDPANASSWFANKDYEQFLRTEENEGRQEWVIMEHNGPGCIVRIWLPLDGSRKNQVVRFYFDGSSKPAITAKFNELLSGQSFVKPPFAFVASDEQATEGVGGDLYLPIPFAKSCKITLDSLPFYYHINYRAYAPETKVKTFTMAAYEASGEALERTAGALREFPHATSGKILEKEGRIEPGREIAFDLPKGAGAVHMLQVQIDPHDAPQVLRSAVYEATFDGETAVWCPLGEFFGCGARLNPVQDWCRRVESNGKLTALWAMPFEKSGRMAIKNLGKTGISVKMTARIGSWQWDDRSLHFHASWRHQYPIKTRPMSDWNYIELNGEGVYVGDTLTAFSTVPAWYGEGDERIYIDGEKFPSHLGTGTEDYYGYAWGMAYHFDSPFISMPQRDNRTRDNWTGYTTTSRLRLLDGISFRKSLKVDMEIWDWADTNLAYAAATFWYARPGAKCNRAPATDEVAKDMLPWPPPPPPQFRGAIECENMKVLAATPELPIERQRLAGLLPGEWSGGAQLFVRATKAGDFVELLLDEKADGPRRITLHATKSHDYGILRFSINGKPVAQEFDGFNESPVPSGAIDLGVCEPKDGRFVLRVELAGSNPASKGAKHYAGLDCVILSPL